MRTRHCHHCGKEYQLPGLPGRSEACPCGADLRVCLNCLHHDPRVADACREDRAEDVMVKDRANYCEWFDWSLREWQPKTQDNRREESARAALNRLLGD